MVDETIENQLYPPKTMKMSDRPEHYKDIYRLHNLEVQDFFRIHRPDALHVGTLEDPDKWRKLGAFLEIAIPAGYESYENRSKNRARGAPPYCLPASVTTTS